MEPSISSGGCGEKIRGVRRAIRVLALAWVVLSALILWLAAETGKQSNAPGQRLVDERAAIYGHGAVSISAVLRSVIEITTSRDFCHRAQSIKCLSFIT